MSAEEQKSLQTEAYKEARRYLANAKETLQKAGKEGRLYNDRKYVRTAAGTAYSGVLLALDAWLQLKGVSLPKAREKSIEWYRKGVAAQDKKLLKELNGAYETLHLAGYYDGLPSVGNMSDGLAIADAIVARLKG